MSQEPGPDRRAENVVLACLAATVVAALAFIVVLVAYPDNLLLGLTLGLAFAAMAAAAGVAGTRLVSQEEAADDYEEFGDEEEQGAVEEIVQEGTRGISRRRLLGGAAGAAGATVGAATLAPWVSLGPDIGKRIKETPWKRGRRLVDAHDKPILADDVPNDSAVTAFAEGAEKSKLSASLIVVRLSPERLRLPPPRRAVAPEGILAFSRICTHAGCAVSLYSAPLFPANAPPPALVCPCHYSTFDVALGGKVIFGPAPRGLPQLPLRINERRELEADGDFFGQVGPTYGGSRL
jgi:ubiquinol-cytochrome c reductase iron-sulfur subunit